MNRYAMRRISRRRHGRVAVAAVVGVFLSSLLPGGSSSVSARRPSAPSAQISSVTPFVEGPRPDSSGGYCAYRADVRLSWSGSGRLEVAQVVDGVRYAPGEVALSGSGNHRLLTVTGIGGPIGGRGPLVANVVVLRNGSWDNVVATASSTPVGC